MNKKKKNNKQHSFCALKHGLSCQQLSSAQLALFGRRTNAGHWKTISREVEKLKGKCMRLLLLLQRIRMNVITVEG